MSLQSLGFGGSALLVLGLVVLIGCTTLCLLFGMRATTGAILVLTVFIAPLPLAGGGGIYNEIAPARPVLQASTAVILLSALVVCVVNRRIVFPWIVLPLFVYLIVGSALIWPHDNVRFSGTVLLGFACIAWFVGANVHEWCFASEKAWTVTNVLLLSVALLQVVFCIVQWSMSLGDTPAMGSVVTGGGDADLAGRASGTFAHPGTLGKIMFILAPASLLALESPVMATRRIGLATLSVSFVAVLFTQSRANIVAYAALVALYLVLSRLTRRPGTRVSREKRVAWLSVLVGSVVGAAVVLSRFTRDPDGGQREHFLQVGLDQFARAPIFGVGPNAYLEQAGMYDRLTAEGWPVHNTVLLVACELGAVGLVLFSLPFVVALFVAISRVRWESESGPYARIWVASIPGLFVVLGSGWGMLNLYVVVAWFLATGFIARGLLSSRVEPSRILRSEESGLRVNSRALS